MSKEVHVIYEDECIETASSDIHAEMIIRQFNHGKGIDKKTEDTFGYSRIEVVDKELDN